MLVLYLLSIILSVYLIYLLIIILLPVLTVEPQPFRKNFVTIPAPEQRESVSFKVQGDVVSAWYYGVDRQSKGCIILSHGFNGTKDCILEDYAVEFNRVGFSVLTYDYRSYGGSDGFPRQLLSVTNQQNDLRAAIGFIRDKRPTEHIFLWGTSAGASYGLIVAAEDSGISGVICQCGAYDHKEDAKRGIRDNGLLFYLKLLPHGIRDKWRIKLGLSNHIIPAYGRSGTNVFIRGDSIFNNVEQLGVHSRDFINEVSASFMLQPHGRDVLEAAKEVSCPVLIVVCENDEIIPLQSHYKLREVLGSLLTVVRYPIGHFEIYRGEWFIKAIEEQIRFINRVCPL